MWRLKSSKKDGESPVNCLFTNEFLLAMHAAEAVGSKDPDQQGNATDPDQRDGVGQVHVQGATST